MGLQRYPLQMPFLGIDEVSDPLDMDPRFAVMLGNISLRDLEGTNTVVPDPQGVQLIRPRYGREQVTATLPDAQSTIYGWIYSQRLSKFFLAAFNNSTNTVQVWTIDPNVGTFSSLGTLGSSGPTFYNAIQETKDSAGNWMLWFPSHGANPAKKSDGTTISNWANSPPAALHSVVWKNRMVLSPGNLTTGLEDRIFFSDVGDPESPAGSYGTNWVDIRDGAYNPTVGLGVLEDKLIVFKLKSIFEVYDPSTFANRKIRDFVTTRNSRILTKTVNFDLVRPQPFLGHLVWPGIDGRIHALAPNGDIKDLGWQLNLLRGPTDVSVLTSPERLLVMQSYQEPLGTASKKIYEGYPVGGNIDQIAWVSHSISLVGEIYAASSTSDPSAAFPTIMPVPTLGLNYLVEGDGTSAFKATRLSRFSGTTDNGTAITSMVRTRWTSFLSDEPIERIMRLNLVHEGRLTVKLYHGFDDETVVYTKEIADPSVGEDEPRFSAIRPNSRSRYHMVEISNSGHPGDIFKLYSMEASIRGGKEH